MEEPKRDAYFLLSEIVAHLNVLVEKAEFLKVYLESDKRRLRAEAERDNE